MSTLGDLLAKEEPTLQDRHRIRLEMNKLQTQVSSLSAWMAPGGNLTPNLFQQYASRFSVLPHECAAMYQGNAQTIGNNTDTTLAPYDATSTATWSHGLEIDATNGFIKVTGIPRDTVLISVGSGAWVANATGYRKLWWESDDASTRGVTEFNPDASLGTEQMVTHIRRVGSAQTHYMLRVKQTSGGNLDFNFFVFAVARLR